MKILVYNISSCTQQKSEKLFKQNADVYVVPEIAAEEEQFLTPDFEMKWNGIKYEKSFMGTKSKGLGIIWRKGHGKIADWYDESLTYAIPLIYDGGLIIGFWPTHNDNCKSYTKIAGQIIEKYSSNIAEYKQCVITGDFNLYKSSQANIITVNKRLNELGLKSIYHSRENEDFGSETKATYHHKPMNDKQFFLDYAYSKQPVKDYRLLNWDKDFSDHVGQLIIV